MKITPIVTLTKRGLKITFSVEEFSKFFKKLTSMFKL